MVHDFFIFSVAIMIRHICQSHHVAWNRLCILIRIPLMKLCCHLLMSKISKKFCPNAGV